MMPESRVRVIGRRDFSPREWLRREVLWAYLMTPYSRQLKSWLDGSQESQHSGNASRQHLYRDLGEESLAFFNQGKNIAGLISSVALFQCMSVPTEGVIIKPLEIQAHSIDDVVTGANQAGNVLNLSDSEVYAEAGVLVRKAVEAEHPDKQSNLLKASLIMKGLAAQETQDWLRQSHQDEHGSLPPLEIQDGGYPRSGGDRVNLLQPIFQKIVSSAHFKSLAT